MNELQKALGVIIKEQRNTLQAVTQEELAKRSGVSRATVANIESGRQSVTITTLYRLSRGLEIDAGTLLNRASDKAFAQAGSLHLSDVDDKPEVLEALKKFIK